MHKPNYTNIILEIIKKGKAIPHWSISDYLGPIRDLYAQLSAKEKTAFRLAVIELLSGREHLENILDICREVHLKEACPILIKLFLNPPRYKENGHPVWVQGFCRSVAVTLGEIRCRSALSLLRQVVESKVSGKGSKQLRLDLESYGVVIQALTSISPKDAAKYFGWWIAKGRELNRQTMALVKKTDDWKKMEDLGIELPIDEESSPVIQNCILSVAKQGKLVGLKRWLASIVLLKANDRNYLEYQLHHLLTGVDPLANLKDTLKFDGDSQALAEELASLPSSKEK